MSAKNKPAPGQEIVLTRVFAAPRELVFAAWTDPKQLAAWWGPRGFTNPVCEWDARAGGKIHDVMRGPDGTDHPMGGAYLEIQPPGKLVMTTGALDAQGALLFAFHHVITFGETQTGTALTIRSRIISSSEGSERYTNGYRAGMTSSLEKLAGLVEPMAAREIVNVRVLPAPPAQVFGAFRDPVRLAQWWGPKGFTCTFHEFDFRPDGVWRFTMHGPDGATYAMDKVLAEIVPERRIVLKHFQPGHDFTLAMEFAPQGAATELTWRMRFADPAEGARLRDFIFRANEENFDRLAAHLAG